MPSLSWSTPPLGLDKWLTFPIRAQLGKLAPVLVPLPSPEELMGNLRTKLFPGELSARGAAGHLSSCVFSSLTELVDKHRLPNAAALVQTGNRSINQGANETAPPAPADTTSQDPSHRKTATSQGRLPH